jgi:hypothetical protein
MCTLGIMVVSLICIPCPVGETALDSASHFFVYEYYRIVLGLPIFFAIIQMALMCTIFSTDTPVALKKRGDYDTLTALLSKIYVQEQVAMRM